jgi:hypothetical protein
MESQELLILTMVWPRHVAPRAGDIHRHEGQDYRITGFLPAHRDDWFHKSITLTLESGLVTVLCRSPLSLCHLGFEGERADAAQI